MWLKVRRISSRRTLRDSFYKHHHDLNTPKATDSLVYTEGVIICKTDEDLYTQREIGKQLFLVDILHHENDRVRKGGYSFISRDSLAACASMAVR